MTHEKLVQISIEATNEVFNTMLALEVSPGEARVERSALAPTAGILSFIGLAGAWAGTGSIACSATFACRISGALLMTEYDAVNEEVLDAVAEVTNMIIGNVKTLLEQELGPMGLSIPTVIYGRNFSSRTNSPGSWIVVPFKCGEDEMQVQLCLVPQREAAPPTRYAATDFAVPVL